MSKKFKEYIKFSFDQNMQNHFSNDFEINGISVLVEEPLPEHVDVNECLKHIFSLIPKHLISNLSTIKIGQYDKFIERNINAFYENGILYITNQQDNNSDMIDDIVHEIAHGAEEIAKEEIYGDRLVKKEFLGKKKRILDLLKEHGYNITSKEYETTKYKKEFDYFLYSGVKASLLKTLSIGLFVSPYALTSLREYFSTGFEEYFLGDKSYLKKISPALYSKINSITKEVQNYGY
tara:strand:- start:180 stop:884 length:705 start_codon:yes stop_codon:yes gene_type:complete